MTAMETAKNIVEHNGLSANEQVERIISMVAKILTAADAAVEAEREACAKLADDQVKTVSGSLDVAGVDRSGLIALKIAREIRARSDS